MRTKQIGIVAIALLWGCSGHRTETSNTNTLRYPLQIEPSTIDPAKNEAADTSDALQNVYEGLINIDKNNQVIPCVAERWEVSKDGLTHTFHLNPKVKFHKPYDRPVTADDVKYSITRLLLPATKSPIWPNVLIDIAGAKEVIDGKQKDVSGIKIIDKQTLSVTLTHPCGYYPYELGGNYIVCRDAIEKTGGNIDEKSSIGTGPFMLKEFKPNRRILLAANSDYWGGAPKLDAIERPVVLDEQTAHIKYESGEVEICQPSQTDYETDMKKPGLQGQTLLQPTAGINYLVLHPKLQPLFRDKRVRQAFAMAVDKDEIVRVAYRGLSKRADGFLTPGVLGYNKDIKKMPYDPAGARALLAQAGYPGGAGFPKLTLVYVQKQAAVSSTVAIVRDNLKRNLGISVDLQEREAATFFADSDKEVMPFFFIGWSATEPHDYLSLLMRTGARYNAIGFSNAEFDRLCDAADREQNPDTRAKLYSQADQIVVDEVAVIPINIRYQPFLVKPYVKDLQFNLGGLMAHYTTRLHR